MIASKKNNSHPPATVQNFPIVGIGASAGGLDAFKRLLSAIPENSGMAYVLVQHLDPNHESILPDILQRVTKIPVYEITDDIHLAPDHIYIIPSNKILTSTDGVLQLTPRKKKTFTLSIDIFFTSLADVHKECAVGIVLSGTGSDGTLGLKAIKEQGGISIVQDSESAAYDSMPQSAINAGVVDFVLAPENIPAQLLQITSLYKSNHFFKEEEQLPKSDEDIFKQILMLLRQRSGVDFTYYKQPTFHRRIARRIAITKKENLANYLKFLRTDKVEQDALFQDVLIPVTSFFRDPKTFQKLTDTVFPALFKNKAIEEPIRVWIAGCSTGEEAFSIAICLHEFLSANPESYREQTKIQIFATDISEKAIKKARAAIYTKADVDKLSETQIKHYFVKNNGNYEVSKLIRDMCVFAPHNFLKDSPFAKMDLITCRNVLIYMDTFLQKKAFTIFHYALKENGFLLLGKSETPSASSDLFTQVEKHEKIYSRKPVPGRFMHVATERKEEFFLVKDKTATKQEGMQTDFRKSAEAIMISKSPASVVVNDAMDIVHIHGDITPFLQTPQGKPTYNLLKMAREGLAFELRNAIHKAKKEQATVTKENIPVKANDQQSLVTIEIIPLNDTIELHFLIRFEKKIILVVPEEKKFSSGKLIETQKQNEQLEKELSQTREDMRSITEDMEAANEELQSANEELQSSNEEMQSLNEELETSKEELQSTNEELTIVNQELQDKQEQLNASYSEQVTARKRIEVSEKEQKKMASQLKMATDSAKVGIWSYDIVSSKLEWSTIHKKMWGYSEHREGLIYEDWHKMIVEEDKEMAFQKIEESKVNHGIYEVDYRINRANDGVLVWVKSTGLYYYDEFGEAHTLTGISIDITEQKEAAEKIKANNFELATKNKQIEASETKFRNLILQAPVAICTYLGPTFIVETVNKSTLELWGMTFEKVINKPLFEVSPETEDSLKKILTAVYTTGEPYIGNEIPVQFLRSGRSDEAFFNIIYQPLRNLEKNICGIISIATEVTETVNARKLIEASEKRFSNILSQSIMAIGILKGTDMVIESANEQLLKIWGKGPEIVGKPLFEVMIELKGQQFPKQLNDVFTTGIPHTFNENRALILNNGKSEERFFSVVIQPYTEVDATITGVTVIGTETTDYVSAKKRVEESEKQFRELSASLEVKVKERTSALQILNEELNQTNNQLEQFAYVASHDLQEPLRKIVTFAKRLKDMHNAELNTDVTSYLNKIETASSRMSMLISNLLNYSRLLQHEKLFVQTDLNDILKDILYDFELLILDKKAQITFDKLPTIEAIPLQMNQLFYNLINNALKFSKKDVPSVITITSRTLLEKQIQKYPALIKKKIVNGAKPNLYIELIFKDNGIGFEQQYSKKIFTIFQRLHNQETFVGTGIGLALTKKIVENHHGEIFAVAKENKGAAFHVILPIKNK